MILSDYTCGNIDCLSDGTHPSEGTCLEAVVVARTRSSIRARLLGVGVEIGFPD